ncbi:uncharacterized protein LOC134252707 [Saccostrea cucullata]|uniref:uncharacterized protein LOC134252707 n=1 Tax=Saccostrea cuccullata TaxID=36930 RepID=UPI002ED2F5D8
MDKIQIIIIALIASGVVCMAVSFGVGVASLLDEYWIDYAFTTTTSATVSGMPATVVAVAKANIGLFTTCYNIDTTTTVTSIFGSTTTNLNTNACVDSATTGYINGDTVKMIQSVGQVAGVFLGLAFISGILIIVLHLLKKLAKPVCFVSLTPGVIASISTLMLLVALVMLNGELVSGMELGKTATMGIVALVFAFLATVTYSVAAAFIIKGAMSPKTAKVNDESTENSTEMKETEKEKPSTEANTASP